MQPCRMDKLSTPMNEMQHVKRSSCLGGLAVSALQCKEIINAVYNQEPLEINAAKHPD